MHHITFPLDLAVDCHHAGTKNYAALLLEQAWPDDDVDDTGLVLDRHEHHTFGTSWALAYEHEAGGHQPTSIWLASSFGTGDDASLPEILSQKGEGMLSKR